jgi:hypothetical protein
VEGRHVVEIHVEVVAGAAGHAGDGAHEGDPVTAVHGQLGDLLIVDEIGLLHRVGGHEGNGHLADGEDFGDGADFHADLADVEFGVDVEGYDQFGLLEAGFLDADAVSTRHHVDGLEAAGFVAVGDAGDGALGDVGEDDGGVGDNGSGGVDDSAADILRLRAKGRRCAREDKEKDREGRDPGMFEVHEAS